jgi:hypothetical protein
VHGDVDPASEQGLLELLHEDTARADLAERTSAIAIARRRYGHQRDLDARPPQPICGNAGLSEREPTAAGADAYEHGTSTNAAPAARTSSAAVERERTRSEPGREAACR